MFVLICSFLFLSNVACSIMSHEPNASSPVELLISRDIDYKTMIGHDDAHFSNLISHTMSDYGNKRMSVSQRMTIPYGHKFTIKALKIFPTWFLQYRLNGSAFNIKGGINMTQYIMNHSKFNVKFRHSCRYFSINERISNLTHVNFTSALNDWNDTIGSLSMPCSSSNIGGNTEFSDSLFNNVPFKVNTRGKLWWSYIYEISLFLSVNKHPLEGFVIDSSNITKMIERTKMYYDLYNYNKKQIILLEPNSFWIEIEIISPFFTNYTTLLLSNHSDSSVDVDYTNVPNIDILSSVRIPVWNVNYDSISSYESINNTFDNTYSLSNYKDMCLLNFTEHIDLGVAYKNLSGYDDGFDIRDYTKSGGILSPFFLSPHFRDIWSQAISTRDENNFLRMGWIYDQVISIYNNAVYNITGFDMCFDPWTNRSVSFTDKRGLFNFVSPKVKIPFISYRIYGMHIKDHELSNNSSQNTTLDPDIMLGLNITFDETLNGFDIEGFYANMSSSKKNDSLTNNNNNTNAIQESFVKLSIAMAVVFLFIVIVIIVISYCLTKKREKTIDYELEEFDDDILSMSVGKNMDKPESHQTHHVRKCYTYNCFTNCCIAKDDLLHAQYDITNLLERKDDIDDEKEQTEHNNYDDSSEEEDRKSVTYVKTGGNDTDDDDDHNKLHPENVESVQIINHLKAKKIQDA